jgi:phytochelatin synthase
MISRRLLTSLFTISVATLAFAEDAPLPKFGPEAVPIFQSTKYLREAPAPDYWNLAPFYLPQQTTSDCSVAAIAMAVNALRGVPANADQQLVTENSLMGGVADEEWMVKVTEDGNGVTFEDTSRYLRKAFDAFELGVSITSVQPVAASPEALEGLRAALAENEKSADTVMLVYFNQGVITGDWDGPHISPIGAYDAASDRVLIMDVDRTWYVPYWTSTETLLNALIKPIAEEHKGLAGGQGGYIIAARAS